MAAAVMTVTAVGLVAGRRLLPRAYTDDLAVLAFRAGAGLVGIWWGLAAGLTVVALLLVLWLRRRGPASLGPGEPAAATAP